MAEEKLDDLPPEERIKKLKELEEKKKKEIEEARAKLKQSEDELTERRKWADKVPIPQVASEDVDNLSVDEKKILKAHHGIKETVDDDSEDSDDEDEESKEEVEGEISLEEKVSQERIELPPEIMDSEYAIQLSQRPMQDIYGEISAINQAVEDKGYVSQEEERRVQYLASAVERKLEDVDAGKYSFTEETAHAASVTQQLGAKLHGTYTSAHHKSKVRGFDYKP